MFKTQDEIIGFVDSLERFVKAVVTNEKTKDVEDALILNKKRDALEEYLMNLSGINSSIEPEEYRCPDCNGDMVLRTNKAQGNQFWGCKKFPECRGTRDLEGLSKADKEERKYRQEQIDQQAGFSFNRAKRDPVTEVSPPTPEPAKPTWINPFAK